MVSDRNGLSAEEKTNRIAALIDRLHSEEYQTFLEIQFESLDTVYQAYSNSFNIVFSPPREPAVQKIIDKYGLQIDFTNRGREYITITAFSKDELIADTHKEIVAEVISEVYDTSFGEISLAFLSERSPSSPEPLLWTDIE